MRNRNDDRDLENNDRNLDWRPTGNMREDGRNYRRHMGRPVGRDMNETRLGGPEYGGQWGRGDSGGQFYGGSEHAGYYAGGGYGHGWGDRDEFPAGQFERTEQERGIEGNRFGGMRQGFRQNIGGQSFGVPNTGAGVGDRGEAPRFFGQDRSVERGPHYGKGPKGYKRSDDRIREEVCDLIARQGHIDATDVEVTVENGVVRLAGTVADRAEKRRLEMLIDDLHGVDDVRNEIRVKRMDETTSATRVNGDPPRSLPSQRPH